MTLDPSEIKHMARLARLEVSESQISVITDKIGSVINHIATMAEVDTTTAHDNRDALVRRPDSPEKDPCSDLVSRSQGFQQDEHGNQFVRVPTVVDKSS